MVAVAGLSEFLQEANLLAHLGRAEALCGEWGAVDIAEILADSELFEELVAGLELKKLERRRLDTAAADVLAGRLELRPQQPASPPAAPPPAARAAVRAEAEPARIQSFRRAPAARAAKSEEEAAAVNPFFASRDKVGCREEPDNGMNPFFSACTAGQALASTGRTSRAADQDVNPFFVAAQREPEDEHVGRQSQHFFPQGSADRGGGISGDRRDATGPQRRGGAGAVPQASADEKCGHFFAAAADAPHATSSSTAAHAGPSFRPAAAPVANAAAGRGRARGATRSPGYQDIAAAPLPRASVLDALAEKKRQDEEALVAKREAARQRRRRQDTVADNGPERSGHLSGSSERRTDPEDGKAYSFKELCFKYHSCFTEQELMDYFQAECAPAPATTSQVSGGGAAASSPGETSGYRPGGHGGGGGGQGFAGSGARSYYSAQPAVPSGHGNPGRGTPQAGRGGGGGGGSRGAGDPTWVFDGRRPERRVDPDDGKAYTFDEFWRKNRAAFSEAEIQEYWRDECRAVGQ